MQHFNHAYYIAIANVLHFLLVIIPYVFSVPIQIPVCRIEWNTTEKLDQQHSITHSYRKWYIDSLVQDCSLSFANALEILQSCTKA